MKRGATCRTVRHCIIIPLCRCCTEITPRQAPADAASAQRPSEERSQGCAQEERVAIDRRPHCGCSADGESVAGDGEPWLPLLSLVGWIRRRPHAKKVGAERPEHNASAFRAAALRPAWHRGRIEKDREGAWATVERCRHALAVTAHDGRWRWSFARLERPQRAWKSAPTC
jgi:hypothetical protein